MRRCGIFTYRRGRKWTCCLPRDHNGDCYATRWAIERAIWEWDTDHESAPEPQVDLQPTITFRAPEDPPTKVIHVPSPTRDYDGRRPKRKHRKKVYAAPGTGVRTAVSWSGYEVDYPSTDDLDSRASLVW